jgi:hypothetical protein
MYVESMSFEEIRREFDKEETVMSNKIWLHSGHVLRQMRKTKMTALDKYFEWTSPNKNKWTYHYTIDLTKPKADQFFVSLYCIFFTERSYAVLSYSKNTGRISYFTSHFFTRYFERENLSHANYHDVIRKFMTVNTHFITSPVKKIFEGKFDVFIQLKSGAAFGSLHSAIDLVQMRTYITNDMLKGDQVALSKALDEKFQLGVLRKKGEKSNKI